MSKSARPSPHVSSIASTALTPQGSLFEDGIHGLLGYQLAQAAIITTAAYQRVVGKPFDLRPVEFTLLRLVMVNAPVTPTRLSKALAMTTPGVTQWLDRLEERGLLKRTPSQSDRRAVEVTLTTKGSALSKTTLDLLLGADAAGLRNLSEGERLILLELLHKVAQQRAR